MSAWGEMRHRASGKTIRKEDEIHFPFEDKDRPLTSEEKSCIKIAAQLPFPLGNYNSFDDLLSALTIRVVVVPGIEKRHAPLSLWEAKETLERNDDGEKAALVLAKIKAWEAMPLRGYYDPANKVIKLFPDEMQQEYGGKCMKQLLVSTLAHEAMHAFFDRPGHDYLPYVVSVEEPMAEFGMLLYLHENKENETVNEFYGWAENDVRAKKTCYRYGFSLMHQHLKEAEGLNSGKTPTRRDLESYKTILF